MVTPDASASGPSAMPIASPIPELAPVTNGGLGLRVSADRRLLHAYSKVFVVMRVHGVMKRNGFILGASARFYFPRAHCSWSLQLKIPYSETKIAWVGRSAVEYIRAKSLDLLGD
jgi:hypothetical protein